MQCHRLAEQISALDPELTPVEVARLCLLILNGDPAEQALQDPAQVKRLSKAAGFRLKAASDQHAAMTDELNALCSEGPLKFNPDQIWTLVRAIKVQSQVLDLYTDQPAWV